MMDFADRDALIEDDPSTYDRSAQGRDPERLHRPARTRGSVARLSTAVRADGEAVSMDVHSDGSRRPVGQTQKIGRASCRERVDDSEVAGALTEQPDQRPAAL